jgi:2-methylcitrate dehydratase PrpD
MSLPYALAARLALGQAGLSAYAAEERDNPRLRTVMERISLVIDSTIAANEEPFVRIVTRDGRTDEVRVPKALGSPANPVTENTYLAKIRSLSGMALDGVRTERLIESVLGLWGQEDVRGLNHALLSDRPRPPLFR